MPARKHNIVTFTTTTARVRINRGKETRGHTLVQILHDFRPQLTIRHLDRGHVRVSVGLARFGPTANKCRRVRRRRRRTTQRDVEHRRKPREYLHVSNRY